MARVLLLIGIFLLPMLPTFWAIVDVAHRPFRSYRVKIIWFAIVTLIPVLGALLYILYGRRKYTLGPEGEGI